MADTRLNAFPENKYEALAMLYVQNRDLSEATPEKLLDLYNEALEKIRLHEPKKTARVPSVHL